MADIKKISIRTTLSLSIKHGKGTRLALFLGILLIAGVTALINLMIINISHTHNMAIGVYLGDVAKCFIITPLFANLLAFLLHRITHTHESTPFHHIKHFFTLPFIRIGLLALLNVALMIVLTSLVDLLLMMLPIAPPLAVANSLIMALFLLLITLQLLYLLDTSRGIFSGLKHTLILLFSSPGNMLRILALYALCIGFFLVPAVLAHWINLHMNAGIAFHILQLAGNFLVLFYLFPLSLLILTHVYHQLRSKN
jgi:hypothetical protein